MADKRSLVEEKEERFWNESKYTNSRASFFQDAIDLALAHLLQEAQEEFVTRLVEDAHISEDCLDRTYERNRGAIELLRNAREMYERIGEEGDGAGMVSKGSSIGDDDPRSVKTSARAQRREQIFDENPDLGRILAAHEGNRQSPGLLYEVVEDVARKYGWGRWFDQLEEDE